MYRFFIYEEGVLPRPLLFCFVVVLILQSPCVGGAYWRTYYNSAANMKADANTTVYKPNDDIDDESEII